MCEHCDAMRQVLTELTGQKVAAVIMRRAEAKIHGRTIEQISNNFLVVTA